MDNPQIKLKIKNIRAIGEAEIIIDGITVITGENGSGKSTISKLAYHLFKTSIEYDEIIDENINTELQGIFRVIDQLTREMSYLVTKEMYTNIRISVKRITDSIFHQTISEKTSGINLALDNIIGSFRHLSDNNNKESDIHLKRIEEILNDILPQKSRGNNIIELIFNLKAIVTSYSEIGLNLKETRPISVLYNSLEDIFYDSSLPYTYNIEEYGVPILDIKSQKLIPVHSIQKIAYIDTPMIIGLNENSSRVHWNDLNKLIVQSGKSPKNKQIESIFRDQIFNGDIEQNNDSSGDLFLYKRSNGDIFNLLECATGLKSFAIIQLLYKNGFLDKRTLLIIDEPEAHLHPQWIVEYARLVVLLNKQLGVKFLIASHNPDMISAIRYIAEKELTTEKLHFYLAEKDNGNYTYTYRHLGLEIDDIFASFNIALERLDLYGKQNNWQYSPTKTLEHPIASKYTQCVEKICDIAKEEGATSTNFSDEKAINIDKVERALIQQEHRDPLSTMDMSFAITSGKSTNMVLVEMRLNYKNPENISKREIDAKIKHSKNILTHSAVIHGSYYFVFPSKVKERAISVIRRAFSNKANYVALDLAGLNEVFFKK